MAIAIANLIMAVAISTVPPSDPRHAYTPRAGESTSTELPILRPQLDILTAEQVTQIYPLEQVIDYFDDGITPTLEPWFVIWLINQRSIYYGASPVSVLRIASCESHYYPLARNPNSFASGVFQWLPGNCCNAWFWTPHSHQYEPPWISYQRRPIPISAPIIDVDAGVWAFGQEGRNQYGTRLTRQWACN